MQFVNLFIRNKITNQIEVPFLLAWDFMASYKPFVPSYSLFSP